MSGVRGAEWLEGDCGQAERNQTVLVTAGHGEDIRLSGRQQDTENLAAGGS